MYDFLSGMVAAGYLTAALFFFRFWKRTGDSLFLIFNLSFILFALGQVAVLVAESQREDRSWIFLFRLLGFVLLIVAIIAKNVSRQRAD
jgi:uncharacterized protein DUF5985